jgi:uncharacterized protein (DUF2141 family)
MERWFIKGILFGLVVIFSMSFDIDRMNESYMAKAHTYTLTVQIPNIRNNNGWIQLQIYKDQKSFKAETPWKQTHISKKDLKSGGLIYRLSGFSEGTYGLALLDDENKNTKMDYKWLMPTEGFGFSDYYHTGWSRPIFDDFKFHLKSDKKVVMKIRYL